MGILAANGSGGFNWDGLTNVILASVALVSLGMTWYIHWRSENKELRELLWSKRLEAYSELFKISTAIVLHCNTIIKSDDPQIKGEGFSTLSTMGTELFDKLVGFTYIIVEEKPRAAILKLLETIRINTSQVTTSDTPAKKDELLTPISNALGSIAFEIRKELRFDPLLKQTQKQLKDTLAERAKNFVAEGNITKFE